MPRTACACKRYRVDPDTAPYVVDGVPVCTQQCMERIDGAIIAEQIAFRDEHGIEALRARVQPHAGRVVVTRRSDTGC